MLEFVIGTDLQACDLFDVFLILFFVLIVIDKAAGTGCHAVERVNQIDPGSPETE